MEMVDTEQAAMRPSMKERQRQLREDAILDTAEEFLQKKGFSAMTLEDITEAIGISRPTLYQHFDSKEDVLIHVAMRNLRITRERMRGMDPSRPASERLKEFLKWSIERKFGPQREIFYDMTRLAITCGTSDPRLTGPQAEFMGDLESLITSAQEDGGIRRDIRAVLLAEIVLGAMKSITFNRLVQEGKTTSNEISEGLIRMIAAGTEG